MYDARVHVHAGAMPVYYRRICRLGHGHLGTFLRSHSHAQSTIRVRVRSRGGLRNGGGAIASVARRLQRNAARRPASSNSQPTALAFPAHNLNRSLAIHKRGNNPRRRTDRTKFRNCCVIVSARRCYFRITYTLLFMSDGRKERR